MQIAKPHFILPAHTNPYYRQKTYNFKTIHKLAKNKSKIEIRKL